MSTLFPHTIAVVQRAGSRTNGRWTETTANRNITGSVQPVSGKDTQFLPENRRDAGVVKIYCNEKLNVSDFFSGKMSNNNNVNTQNVAPKAPAAPQQQAPKVETKTDFPINYGNQPNNGQKSVDIDLPPFLK